MKTSEIIKHIYSKTLAMDREVQTRIMTAALDYIITGDMQVEGDTEIFMLECFMPMLDEAKKNDEPLSLKRSAAGKKGAEKRWNKQKKIANHLPCPRARGKSLSVSIDNLDINNKFLNINTPESDSKLISPVDNLDSDNNSDRNKLKSLEENREYSSQVIEYKQEDKLKNKKDNTTHVREKNAAAPEIEPAKPPDKKKKSGNERFKVPAVEEVAAYCAERGNNVDAQSWWDFYQSKGWMVGSNKMKDWKAAVRTWEQRHKNETKINGNGNYIKNEFLRYGNTKPEDFKGKGHSTI